MKNKGLVITLILSIILLITLIYFSYFSNKIIFKDFDKTVKTEVLKKYKIKKVYVCYGNNLRCKKISYKVSGKVDINKVGKYELTYTATKNKKTVSKKMIVNVVDEVKPVLTVDGSHDNVCPNGKENGVIYSATDNYDGDITDKIEYKLEENKIIYKVSDSSGNTTIKGFDVTIKDEEKPSIVLNGDNTIYLGTGSEYKEPGYAAVDTCDGDLTNKVTTSSNVNTNAVGNYEVIYKVSDSSGNEATVSRTIKVFPKNSYNPENTSYKVIYLTFDDGPGPYTSRLLDTLALYNVKATFFVVGYKDNYNDIITREYNEGHTVGLHSYTHKYEVIYQSVEAYMNDLMLIKDKVKNLTNYDSYVIRFPGGSSNTVSKRYNVGIMTTLTSKVSELGFRYFDWNISSGDAGGTTSSYQVYLNVINNLKENEPNVILMHDIKSYTVDAIPKIIEYGLANGYTFAPLSVNSPDVHQKVLN